MVLMLFAFVDVDLHWHDQDLVVAGPISKEESGIGGRTEYEVSPAVFNIYS